jgi:signal transduction histidine kinase/nucleotide-binding universal stress UspA family protein
MKVLIPLDNPGLTAEMVDFVAAQCFPADVTFELLHVVVFEPSEIANTVSSEIREFLKRETQLAEDWLFSAQRQLAAKYPRAEIESTVEQGMPADTILAFAEKWGADMIVMPSHNRKGAAKFFLGSVAEAVAKRCRCSVALVRKAEDVAQSPNCAVTPDRSLSDHQPEVVGHSCYHMLTGVGSKVMRADSETFIGDSEFSLDDIAMRKRWLYFTEEDEELLDEIRDLLKENVDPLIDDMYAHFLSFPETSKFFPDEATLARAQAAQKAYFLRLAEGNYGEEYVKDRLRVGTTHYSIGLDPKWYMGAYNRILTWMRRLVGNKYKHDFEKCSRLLAALSRLIFFDMSLAIDSYFVAKEKAIRSQANAISELETERRVTRSILEDAPVGLVRLDEELRIAECNAEFVEMLDRDSRQSLAGESLFDLAPKLPKEKFEAVVESDMPYRAVADPLYLSSAAVTPGYYDWATWPVKDATGRRAGLIAIFSSATDRVLLQQQREDFVATLTHDLKTPILAANRAVKLLMEGDFGPVEESQTRILETIHQSNEALYKLVQTLLDVYRYDSGAKKLVLAQHDVADMVTKLVSELEPLARTKNVQVSAVLPEVSEPVLCDQEELRRVLQNLIDNALKFTPAGGSISVTMQQVPPVTEISVADTGKGISDTDKPKLFQRFWQAAGSGRYYASTGLGLYLCRKIVELHGGKISCSSRLGKGSTFTFTVDESHLPARSQSAAAEGDDADKGDEV